MYGIIWRLVFAPAIQCVNSYICEIETEDVKEKAKAQTAKKEALYQKPAGNLKRRIF